MHDELCSACIGQKSIMLAGAVIVVAANYGKIKRKYTGRGERYAILEAGHVGQNVHLMCEALGLGCVMIGAFSDRKVKACLGINEDPLYVIPVGKV
jgi:SagB-type dehydrogenase family enzyme